VKRPVFSFEAELLTDAPFDHILGRIRNESPSAFKSLRALSVWAAPENKAGQVVLRWSRSVAGAEEAGALILTSHEKGTHLRLEGSMKGWAGVLFFGLLRWRTDRLLDRFVEEL
jgi:hypothetical protein